MADKLDRGRDFTTIIGKLPMDGRAAFRQDGIYYGLAEEFLGKDPNYKPPKASSVRKKEPDTVDKAKDILGGLSPDPRAQVRRENAAAAQADLIIGREHE